MKRFWSLLSAFLHAGECSVGAGRRIKASASLSNLKEEAAQLFEAGPTTFSTWFLRVSRKDFNVCTLTVPNEHTTLTTQGSLLLTRLVWSGLKRSATEVPHHPHVYLQLGALDRKYSVLPFLHAVNKLIQVGCGACSHN